jgi:hypothetical protein
MHQYLPALLQMVVGLEVMGELAQQVVTEILVERVQLLGAVNAMRVVVEVPVVTVDSTEIML